MASCKPTSTSMPASRALQALRPWLEAHVHEVVKESYAHLLRCQTTPLATGYRQRLAQSGVATNLSLELHGGRLQFGVVANGHTIGRTHAHVGVTPQWYLGAFSIFARIFFPKLLAYYHDRPLTGMAAVKALIAVMHLDMQLAIILVVDDDTRMRDLVAQSAGTEQATQSEPCHVLKMFYRPGGGTGRSRHLRYPYTGDGRNTAVAGGQAISTGNIGL